MMKSLISITIVIAFQFIYFGHTQVTITPPIPLNCPCFKEWFDNRAEFFGTEVPRKLARKIFNSWNTVENDDCISREEYNNNHVPNYCGGYTLYEFIDTKVADPDSCVPKTTSSLTKKELKKAIRKIKQNCLD